MCEARSRQWPRAVCLPVLCLPGVFFSMRCLCCRRICKLQVQVTTVHNVSYRLKPYIRRVTVVTQQLQKSRVIDNTQNACCLTRPALALLLDLTHAEGHAHFGGPKSDMCGLDFDITVNALHHPFNNWGELQHSHCP